MTKCYIAHEPHIAADADVLGEVDARPAAVIDDAPVPGVAAEFDEVLDLRPRLVTKLRDDRGFVGSSV